MREIAILKKQALPATTNHSKKKAVIKRKRPISNTTSTQMHKRPRFMAEVSIAYGASPQN